MYAPDIEKHLNDSSYWRERSFAHEQKVQEMRETLRDKIAIAALTGLLTSDCDDYPESFAKLSYKYADAMLLEREVKK